MTKQKILILSIIEHSSKHLSASDILSKAREKLSSISLSTVYRNLGQLLSENKIFKIALDDNSFVYDINKVKHYHIICPICKKISDVSIPHIDEIIKKNIKEFETYELVISAVCDNCKKGNNE